MGGCLSIVMFFQDVFCEVDPFFGEATKSTPVVYTVVDSFFGLTKVISSSQLTRPSLLACLESCCAAHKSEHRNHEN